MVSSTSLNVSYADADVSNQRVGVERTELMDRGVYHSGKYGNFMGPQRGDKGFYYTSDLYGHNLAIDGTGDDPKKLKRILAKLILEKQVGMIIGGLTQSDAQVISKFTKKLSIPK